MASSRNQDVDCADLYSLMYQAQKRLSRALAEVVSIVLRTCSTTSGGLKVFD